MRKLFDLARSLFTDNAGSTVIETALVLPPLLIMSMGTFEVSRMVARQNELQKAANEAGDVVLASIPDTDAKRTALQQVLMTSTGLTADHVTVAQVYRCSGGTTFVSVVTACTSGYSTYIQVTLTDTYTPAWTAILKLGSSANYNIVRQVQIA